MNMNTNTNMHGRDAVLAQVNASWTTQVLRAACLLHVPDHLAQGPLSVEYLAVATGCHGPSLRRLLRAMATLDLCTEAPDAGFALTATGRLLCEDHPDSLRAWALLVGGPLWQRWGELDESVRTGLSHKQRVLGEEGFGDLAANAPAAALFHRAMREMTRGVSEAIADALMSACDLDTAESVCVVDVGGGQGELLAGLLRRHAAWRGVLFDLPAGVQGAQQLLQTAGVAERCVIASGDFFEAVPDGGDVYLLKSVLHNWDDARCVRILGHCRQAMRAGGCVVAVERLMADRLGTGAADRAVARSDLNMLVALTGRERTAAEFAALFARAGLSAPRVVATQSDFALISAKAAAQVRAG
jgi:hypothetical protein